MSPETQAGTDHAALKEQARQAMLRASQDRDESTDAEVEDVETDEVADDDGDDVTDADAEDEDADEADSDDDADDGDAAADDDGDSADDDAGDPTPDDKGKKRKRPSKLARLHQEIADLKAKLETTTGDVSSEVERVLAAKAESDRALADLQRDQAEDAERIKQVRTYVTRLRGTDRERDQLTREIAAVDDADPLAFSDEQRTAIRDKKARLNQILSARDLIDLATEYADADLKDRVSSILAEFAKTLPGVDKNFHETLKFGPAVQHVYDSGYERGKAEHEAMIARHEKTIANLEGKLLDAKTKKAPPARRVIDGGASVPTKPKSKPLDQMTATERAQSMGMFNPDGTRNPEYRKQVQQGLIKLVG